MMREEMEPRFPALMAISAIFKVLAIVAAIIGVITAIGFLFTTAAAFTKLVTFVGLLVGTFIQAILFWAASDFLILLISVEHNTFLTKESVQTRGEMRPAA